MASVARRSHKKLLELLLFAILGALMFVSKVAMEALPNIHSIGLLIAVYTLVFRWKAAVPLYVYVFLNGLYAGFNVWWLPYLYIWAVLYLAVALIPPSWKWPVKAVAAWVLAVLHGLAYGALYAPVWALYAHLSWEGMVSWIAYGFPYDCLHGAGNAVLGVLILPLSLCLDKLKKRYID